MDKEKGFMLSHVLTGYLLLHAQFPPTDENFCSGLLVLQKLDGTTLSSITKWNLSNAAVIHGASGNIESQSYKLHLKIQDYCFILISGHHVGWIRWIKHTLRQSSASVNRLFADTHIDQGSCEASAAKNKVGGVEGAPRQPRSHASHRSSWGHQSKFTGRFIRHFDWI